MRFVDCSECLKLVAVGNRVPILGLSGNILSLFPSNEKMHFRDFGT